MAGLDDVSATQSVEVGPQRLKGAEAFKAHLTLAAGLTLCGAAFWFEIGRAEGGNSLSWAYVFEWPLLGIFAIYMWWKILHPDRVYKKERQSAKPSLAPEYEGMLAAWQEHQQELQRSQEESSSPRAESSGERGDAP